MNGFITIQKKPVKNYKLCKEYLEASKQHKIFASWRKGHAGHKENERCDILSRAEAEKF